MIFNKYKNFKAVFKTIFLKIIVMKSEKQKKMKKGPSVP